MTCPPQKKEFSCNVRLELKRKGGNHGQENLFTRADLLSQPVLKARNLSCMVGGTGLEPVTPCV